MRQKYLALAEKGREIDAQYYCCYVDCIEGPK